MAAGKAAHLPHVRSSQHIRELIRIELAAHTRDKLTRVEIHMYLPPRQVELLHLLLSSSKISVISEICV